MSPFANQRTPGHSSARPTSHSTTLHPMSGQAYHGYPSSSPAPGYGPGPPTPSDGWPQQHLQQTRHPYSYTGSVRPSFPGPSEQYSSAMHGRPFYPTTPSWLMADYQGRFPQQTQGSRSNFSPGFRHGLSPQYSSQYSPQYLCPPPGSLSGFPASLPHPPTYFIGRSHPYQGGNSAQNSSGPSRRQGGNSAPSAHHHSQANCLNNYLSSSMCEMQMMAANMFATMNMSSSSNMSSSFSHSSQNAVHSRLIQQ